MTTRDLLIDLGETAIRSYGFGGFSYADLAREAGIRKASIHHHFPAKTDLGLAVVERYAERLNRSLATISDQSTDAEEALRGLLKLYRAALGDGSLMCICTALAADEDRLSEEIKQEVRQANTDVIEWIETTLIKGCSDGTWPQSVVPADDAIGVLAQLQGAQMLARASGDPRLFDLATSSLLRSALMSEADRS